MGMPTWAVSEPYINLWLHDEPLGYNPGVGNRISFELNYKQREGLAATDTNIFSCGPMWTFSWLSYINANASYSGVTMIEADGGEQQFPANGSSSGPGYTTYSYGPEYYTSTIISAQTNTGSGDFITTLQYPNGAVDYYSSWYYTNAIGTNYFLTAKADPAGHTTQFIYTTNGFGALLLLHVIDADGRTNTLSYTNTSFPSQITGVTDPFGRSINLVYDTHGVLTNITDVAGISSSFMYTNYVDHVSDDMTNTSFYWVTNLITPYGTTTFSYTDQGFPDCICTNNDIINRSVMVVDPMGGTNLYVYRDYSSFMAPYTYSGNYIPPYVPAPCPWENEGLDFMVYRNSWHWGPLQYASLSTTNMNSFTTNDYNIGRQRHWLHSQSSDDLGDALNFQQDPSPDGSTIGLQTWDRYPGQSCPHEGTNALPDFIGYDLTDGNVNWSWIQRNGWSHPTNVVKTFSLGFGTQV